MALFGNIRDSFFVNRINRELVSRIIDTKIGFYQLKHDENNINIYGETTTKKYLDPILISCYVSRQPGDMSNMKMLPEQNNSPEFYFVKSMMYELEIYPTEGDIIVWDETYYRITNVNEVQFFAGKNPLTNYGDNGDKWGDSISIICNTIQVNESSLDLE